MCPPWGPILWEAHNRPNKQTKKRSNKPCGFLDTRSKSLQCRHGGQVGMSGLVEPCRGVSMMAPVDHPYVFSCAFSTRVVTAKQWGGDLGPHSDKLSYNREKAYCDIPRSTLRPTCPACRKSLLSRFGFLEVSGILEFCV